MQDLLVIDQQETFYFLQETCVSCKSCSYLSIILIIVKTCKFEAAIMQESWVSCKNAAR